MPTTTSARCTGTAYPINPDEPSEGVDIHHARPCPAHPEVRTLGDAMVPMATTQAAYNDAIRPAIGDVVATMTDAGARVLVGRYQGDTDAHGDAHELLYLHHAIVFDLTSAGATSHNLYGARLANIPRDGSLDEWVERYAERKAHEAEDCATAIAALEADRMSALICAADARRALAASELEVVDEAAEYAVQAAAGECVDPWCGHVDTDARTLDDHGFMSPHDWEALAGALAHAAGTIGTGNCYACYCASAPEDDDQ